MNIGQAEPRTAGVWLATASALLVLALTFHGPLHPDLEVQMTRIAGSASRWKVVHWAAAASMSGFAVASLLVRVSGSRLAGSGWTRSAWAVVSIGALWTLATAVTEVTVIAHLAASGDVSQFEAWWSFAEGNGNGFSLLAMAVAVIAWNEARDPQRLVPKWSAAVGTAAGFGSFTGWALGVWLNIGPANVLWVVASAVMCLWLTWLGTALAASVDTDSAEDRG